MNKECFDLTRPQEKKSFQKLLDWLLEHNHDEEASNYNDIHIYTDKFGFVSLEWDKASLEGEWGGKFQWLDEGDEICEEVCFPDRHYELVLKGTGEEAIKDWLVKHPEWQLTSYGMWTNTEENRYYAIDYRVDDWLKREVQENDSTFTASEHICKKDDLLTVVLAAVDTDIIKRTDYIVVGSPLVSMCLDDPWVCKNSAFDEELGISKIGTCDIEFTHQEPWQENPECIQKSIHVYHSPKVESNIFFLTSEHYLIHKVTVKKEDN